MGVCSHQAPILDDVLEALIAVLDFIPFKPASRIVKLMGCIVWLIVLVAAAGLFVFWSS